MKYHILPMKNDQYIASLDSIAVPAVHKDDLKPGIEKAGRPANSDRARWREAQWALIGPQNFPANSPALSL